MTSLWARYALPRLTDLVMRGSAQAKERAKFVPLAVGTVLEVGAGSGLNIPFYGAAVRRLYALDPSNEIWRLARRRLTTAKFPIEYLGCPAESIPLADHAVDSVVSTWTLCTIPDPHAALKEMKRVLTAEGQLIFVEHGRSPEQAVRAWQDRINPAWKRVAGGCNLNRRIDDQLIRAGFRLSNIDRGYSEGPRVFGYLYKGVAVPEGA